MRKKLLLLLGVSVILSGCVSTINKRKIIVNKDKDGKIIGYQVIEEQEQRYPVPKFKFKYLNEKQSNLNETGRAN